MPSQQPPSAPPHFAPGLLCCDPCRCRVSSVPLDLISTLRWATLSLWNRNWNWNCGYPHLDQIVSVMLFSSKRMAKFRRLRSTGKSVRFEPGNEKIQKLGKPFKSPARIMIPSRVGEGAESLLVHPSWFLSLLSFLGSLFLSFVLSLCFSSFFLNGTVRGGLGVGHQAGGGGRWVVIGGWWVVGGNGWAVAISGFLGVFFLFFLFLFQLIAKIPIPRPICNPTTTTTTTTTSSRPIVIPPLMDLIGFRLPIADANAAVDRR